MCNGSKMARTVTVRLEKPIALARILDKAPAESTRGSVEAGQVQLPEVQNEKLSQVCQVLQEVINKVNDLQENVLKRHKEEIAKLSVEIARKILMQKVQDGDYRIESVVEETLEKVPTRQDVVVHLNPEDLVQYQELHKDDSNGKLSGIKFVSDPNVGRAECVLETPKGIVESFINEHLERIGEALRKAN